MAFSFDPALVSALDRVRYSLGDVTAEGALLQDETILAAIAARGETGATGYLASGLATRLAYEPDSVNIAGALSVRFSRVGALQAAAAGAGSSGAGAKTTSRAGQRDDDVDRAEYIRTEWSGGYGAQSD